MQQVLIITDALWTRSAILALLALYEAKINMLDNHKKRGKIYYRYSSEKLKYLIY